METIEDRIIQGWMVPEALTNIKVVSPGVIMASVGSSTVMVLGTFQRAIVIGQDNLITDDLACRDGR